MVDRLPTLGDIGWRLVRLSGDPELITQGTLAIDDLAIDDGDQGAVGCDPDFGIRVEGVFGQDQKVGDSRMPGLAARNAVEFSITPSTGGERIDFHASPTLGSQAPAHRTPNTTGTIPMSP